MPIAAIDLPTAFDVVNACLSTLALGAAWVAIRQTRRQSRFDRRQAYQARLAVVVGRRSAVVGHAMRQAGEMMALLREVDVCIPIATPESKADLEELRDQVAGQVAAVEGVVPNQEFVMETASTLLASTEEPTDDDFVWLARAEAETELLIQQSGALTTRILAGVAACRESLARTRSNLERCAG